MSTRCTINFCFPDGEVCAKVYRHTDGYPDGDSGVPADLARFFKAVQEQTDDPRFGDPSYLAAKFVVWQANEHRRGASLTPLDFLGVGILMEDPGDIAYSYNVICGPSRALFAGQANLPQVRVVKVR